MSKGYMSLLKYIQQSHNRLSIMYSDYRHVYYGYT